MSDMPVDLREDGTVRLALDKGVITLRRPLIGQLRALQESLEQTNEDVRELLPGLSDSPERPTREEGESDDTFDARLDAYNQERRECRAADRKVLAELDEIRVAWTREVCAALGDKPLPDVPVNDLPTWAASTAVAVALVDHWQRIPLARGGK